MRRVPSRELLDDDAGTAAEVMDSLADIRFLNHYFGGLPTTLCMVRRVVKASKRADLSMLEVAAGTGDLPRCVRARMQKNGVDLRLTLLDRCASHMCEERRKVVADALALPFADSTFDLINCCLFVHHLSPEQVAAFVKEALRCSRVAVLINDLVRHPIHFAMACAGRLIYRSRITRNDAPASVRQSYTTEEMRNMLQDCGAARVDITRHYFYRMGAIVWKTSNGDRCSNV
ncbi:MAG TPA: methyltransferase domain-containing protein [Bryobacteraceae bacterium]|jgi:ubiquinone/menaquinone biosynthesis C-methylase UbiE